MNSHVHPIFRDILRRFEPKPGQHQGTTPAELYAAVDNALDIYRREPWTIIAAARTHLTDKPMDEADVRTWWELGKFQDALIDGTVEVCRLCGEIEGLHQLGEYCRKDADLPGYTASLSPRFEAKR